MTCRKMMKNKLGRRRKYALKVQIVKLKDDNYDKYLYRFKENLLLPSSLKEAIAALIDKHLTQ